MCRPWAKASCASHGQKLDGQKLDRCAGIGQKLDGQKLEANARPP